MEMKNSIAIKTSQPGVEFRSPSFQSKRLPNSAIEALTVSESLSIFMVRPRLHRFLLQQNIE